LGKQRKGKKKQPVLAPEKKERASHPFFKETQLGAEGGEKSSSYFHWRGKGRKPKKRGGKKIFLQKKKRRFAMARLREKGKKGLLLHHNVRENPIGDALRRRKGGKGGREKFAERIWPIVTVKKQKRVFLRKKGDIHLWPSKERCPFRKGKRTGFLLPHETKREAKKRRLPLHQGEGRRTFSSRPGKNDLKHEKKKGERSPLARRGREESILQRPGGLCGRFLEGREKNGRR